MIRQAINIILMSGLSLCLFCGCASTRQSPDLAKLYNKSSQYHVPYRNPIIVIPDILGSKLIEPESGQVVWGTFGGSSANPRNPHDAHLIALPMREGAPLTDLKDTVIPNGVLDKVKVKLFGPPIQLDAYVHILVALGIGGYRDELLGQLGEIDYGDDHYTCFQFDYDWRRDNVENAQRIYQLILEKRAYVRAETRKRYGIDNPDIKFDVVSHSMGGLLLRYMLRYGDANLSDTDSPAAVTWAGAELVERAILVSPPNSGSILTIDHLLPPAQISLCGRRNLPRPISTPPANTPQRSDLRENWRCA